jgi:hypothetical protein
MRRLKKRKASELDDEDVLPVFQSLSAYHAPSSISASGDASVPIATKEKSRILMTFAWAHLRDIDAISGAFFSAPVTDSIAPHYSEIIPLPMDLSVIQLKCGKKYKDLHGFDEDVRLMLTNCLRYNMPTVISDIPANGALALSLLQDCFRRAELILDESGAGVGLLKHPVIAAAAHLLTEWASLFLQLQNMLQGTWKAPAAPPAPASTYSSSSAFAAEQEVAMSTNTFALPCSRPLRR